MEQVNEAQPQSQPSSQRFYALEQLGELAGTITLISEGLQAYREQVAGLLAGQKKAEAFELYRLLERQRTYLVEQIRATRPFLMELENPLAPAAQKLAEQLAAFPLMTADYSKLTEVLKRFADALPDHQTTDASIIGRLMNNVRLGHYPTDLTHVGYIANSIVFPAGNTANLIDPCCGTGDALLRLALGTDSQCYGIELDDHRAEQAQQQLYRVGFGSFFGSNISPGAFHTVFLNPPYLSVLSENGGRSRDEKRFLIESIPLLMMGGLLIYIVPYYRLTADLCGIICDNFEQVRIHRFLDREFKQFKQVVITGVRRRRTEAEQDAEALCSAAERPETLPKSIVFTAFLRPASSGEALGGWDMVLLHFSLKLRLKTGGSGADFPQLTKLLFGKGPVIFIGNGGKAVLAQFWPGQIFADRPQVAKDHNIVKVILRQPRLAQIPIDNGVMFGSKF